MLQSHPQIHMPRKEPSYFVPEIASAHPKSYARRFPNGIDSYASLFDGARAEQRIGEASPSYLWSESAASCIAEARPEARIIAILREPASFLRSLHLQFLQSNVENERDLRKAIALEQPRREGKRLPRNSTRPQALLYSEHVRYVAQLRRYHAVFGPDQVLVLIYEDFRADNEGTVRQVLRFLDIDELTPIQLVDANPTVAMRSQRLHDVIRSLYLGRAPATRTVKRTVKALTAQGLRRDAMATIRRMQATDPPAADDELMDELRHRFTGEVAALSDYLNRDLLAFWSYDRLD